MEVVIRTATFDDAPELARLRWDFSPEEAAMGGVSYDDFQKQFESFFAGALQRRWQVWVAKSKGQIVGNMWLQLVEKVPRPGDSQAYLGYLTNVYIEEQHRGKGLGQQMLEQVVEWGRKEKLELILVWPSAEGRSLYRKLGFLASSEAQDPGEEAMELHLQ